MKLKKDSIAIIVAVVLVFVYIFYECYSVTHIEFKTETAVLSTVYEKIDATALIVRDEHTVNGASGGVTVPCISDGDKINVGGNVAMTFSSSDDAENYAKYEDIQEKLKYYENLESQSVGRAASVESINSEIENNADSYIRAVSSGDTSRINDAGAKINDSILRRQMIIGENIDLVSIIQDLRQQSESYSSSAKPTGYITTDESGVFSSYTDGFESFVDYEKADEMTIDEINSALQTVSSPNREKSNYFGKLVTSYAWYFECVVSADEVKGLENGDKVQVALKDNDSTVLTVQIISGAEPKIGEKETALIMKSSTLDSKLASIRKEDIEIRTKSYEGIKVPTSALHVSDNKKGVYALISSHVKFREAEVIYSDEDYVLLSFDADNPNGIRLYDQIITQGKELEDGKVYT